MSTSRLTNRGELRPSFLRRRHNAASRCDETVWPIRFGLSLHGRQSDGSAASGEAQARQEYRRSMRP